MKTLARYLEVIVDPTFDDFLSNTGSFRHAYLAWPSSIQLIAPPKKMESALQNFAKTGVESHSSSSWWTSLRIISSMCGALTKKYPKPALDCQSDLLLASMKPAKAWTYGTCTLWFEMLCDLFIRKREQLTPSCHELNLKIVKPRFQAIPFLYEPVLVRAAYALETIVMLGRHH
jgi:hypothetical protein